MPHYKRVILEVIDVEFLLIISDFYSHYVCYSDAVQKTMNYSLLFSTICRCTTVNTSFLTTYYY